MVEKNVGPGPKFLGMVFWLWNMQQQSPQQEQIPMALNVCMRPARSASRTVSTASSFVTWTAYPRSPGLFGAHPSERHSRMGRLQLR